MLPPALWRFLYIIVLFTFLPTSSAQIKIKIKNTQNLQYTQTPTSVQIHWQDKLVFELPKTQLLTAIRQQTKIKHKMGSFKFKQHTQKKCTQSVIQLFVIYLFIIANRTFFWGWHTTISFRPKRA